MATATNGVVRVNRVVTIGEFNFDWILFPDLTEFFPIGRFNIYFNCVENSRGVYFFFNNESGKVSYVGCTENRGIKERITQYRTLSKTGNSFFTAYQKKHPDSSFCDFKTYVQDLRLGTLSINIRDPNPEYETKLMAVNKGMEYALICKFKPTYNAPLNILTSDEINTLTTLNMLPNISSPENSSG